MIYDPFSTAELEPALPGRHRSGLLSGVCEGSYIWKAGFPLSFHHKHLSSFSHPFANLRLFPDNVSWGRRDCFLLI